jgi:hypothetical protein
MHGNTGTLFAERGIGFDEILRDGKLGGRRAVVSYLDIRLKQITRESHAANLEGFEKTKLMLSIRAMTEARHVAMSIRP